MASKHTPPGTYATACKCSRPGNVVVIDYRCNYSAFNGYRRTPSRYSKVRCRDFAVVLATLADLGFHDLAWRVLDSRYFGVPQRRRRVFILARRSRGRRACEVLLEPESGGGDFTARRQAGPRVASTLTAGAHNPGKSAAGRRQEDDWNIVSTLQGGGERGYRIDAEGAAGGHLVSAALTARYGKGTDSDATDTIVSHTLTANGFDASEDGTGRGTPLVADTLRSHPRPGSNSSGAIVPVGEPAGRGPRDTVCLPADGRGREAGSGLPGDQGRPDGPSSDPDGMRAPSGVPGRLDGDRVSCPVDPTPDGHRYRMMGNAVTVPVAEWIGRRLEVAA